MAIFSNKYQAIKHVVSMFVCLFLVFTDCTESDIHNICADPIGSDDMELEDESVFCFMESVNGCFQIKWQDSSIEIISLNLQDKIQGEIVDIGEVNCLGEVISKPENGYKDTVVVLEHHGRVENDHHQIKDIGRKITREQPGHLVVHSFDLAQLLDRRPLDSLEVSQRVQEGLLPLGADPRNSVQF